MTTKMTHAMRMDFANVIRDRYTAAANKDKRRILEEVVRLLESVREGIGRMDKPDFDDGRVDGYVVTALSAVRAALNIAARRQEPAEAGEPDR